MTYKIITTDTVEPTRFGEELARLEIGESVTFPTVSPSTVAYWTKKLGRHFSLHQNTVTRNAQPPRLGRPTKYPIQDLEVGQSFIESDPKRYESVRNRAYHLAKKLNRRFITAATSKGIEVKRFA